MTSFLSLFLFTTHFMVPWTFSGTASAAELSADLILYHGVIRTLDARLPVAQAIAIRKDRILAVGKDAEILSLPKSPGCRLVDLRGRLALPGFIESHVHLSGLGLQREKLDLSGTRSLDEIVQRVRERATELKPGTWLRGYGWNQNLWPEKSMPTHGPISAVTPDRPVVLSRVDGHASFVNRKALELAGITATTPDPKGGRILRDSQGEATGVLLDSAMDLVGRVAPKSSPGERNQAIERALHEALVNGITTVHDAGITRADLTALEDLGRHHLLPVRVYAMIANWREPKLVDEFFKQGPRIGAADGFLTIRAVKVLADGALGSRGAALLHPYLDDPKHDGLLLISEDDLTALAKRALDAGFQLAVHGIGDRANRMILDAYEKAFAGNSAAGRAARFRIEHAQILDPADIGRFARLGVIASVQPTHCTSDMSWVPDRIGERLASQGAYAWKSLLDSGARLVGGSDAPVESINPLWGIYSAVTRQDHNGEPRGGWFPAQALSLQKAVEIYTRDAAYASFEESSKGTLEKGKLADLVVLSRDIFSGAPADLLKTRAEMTIVGGKAVYERP